MTLALEAHAVTKNFDEGGHRVAALCGVSVALERGEVLVLEGPSGSGKTTLLSILGLLLTPSSGRLLIDGTEIDHARPGQIVNTRRRSLGLVFQQYHLLAALTARENIEYALKLRGARSRAARLEADALLEAVQLTEKRDCLPRNLSGGQKQRVAIARALAGDPTVVLADEPTANLDSQIGAQVLQLFRALAKERERALVIVTHDVRVRSICDRVLHLVDGAIAA